MKITERQVPIDEIDENGDIIIDSRYITCYIVEPEVGMVLKHRPTGRIFKGRLDLGTVYKLEDMEEIPK